ncbi:putative transcription factor NAM family [Rosa chinensis]|uniref:Putative transcription factor NAM family n=1 Tax=Rosa chinensis TaxID=74649 RepID=A0A2P6SIZ0_ROSCH|nr:NAC domain-containing protein 14-like [Rosa chinensis]XP_040373875.1 NAC domain-containing protein 14-like [Rosa chinensis]PRQ58655.1 putative transcription factor NAM family [Rosa chinensis]
MATAAVELRVGFRFHPTEEELVNYYLNNKIQGHDFNDIIPEMDICSYEPWDLPGFSLIKSGQEWFYFSKPDYKFRNNRSRANRATERGFWKITGKEREIKARESKAVVGKKRTLTFYKGKVRRGQKNNWVIHEYYIPETLLPNAAKQRDFVLCRLKKKDENTEIGACDEGEPRTNDQSDFENLLALVHTAGVPEENTRPEEILGSLFSSRASPELPQSDDYFSSMLRGNF